MNHPRDGFGHSRNMLEDVPSQLGPGGPEQGLRQHDDDMPAIHDSMPELPPLMEPVYIAPASAIDFGHDVLADHPLLRGLLLELPPRSSPAPSDEWLDRWFDATRSILELLYNRRGMPS